MRWPNKTT